MGTDRYMEERDACPSRLAAANAEIIELQRELLEARRQRDVAEATLKEVAKQRDELRFAQAADRERVRSVVAKAVLSVQQDHPGTDVWYPRDFADHVATRAAEQLAAGALPLWAKLAIQRLHEQVDQTDPNDPVGTALTKAGLERCP